MSDWPPEQPLTEEQLAKADEYFDARMAAVAPPPMHVDYPHHFGLLYDCPACEAECHCEGLNRGLTDDRHPGVVCVHCAIRMEGGHDQA